MINNALINEVMYYLIIVKKNGTTSCLMGGIEFALFFQTGV